MTLFSPPNQTFTPKKMRTQTWQPMHSSGTGYSLPQRLIAIATDLCPLPTPGFGAPPLASQQHWRLTSLPQLVRRSVQLNVEGQHWSRRSRSDQFDRTARASRLCCLLRKNSQLRAARNCSSLSAVSPMLQASSAESTASVASDILLCRSRESTRRAS